MKMTRVLAILLTLLMVFGVVACDNEQPQVDPSGRTIVTMTYWNKQDTMQPLIDLIEKQLPDVKIQYNYVSNTTYTMTTSTKLLGGNADDIIAFSVGQEVDYGNQGLLVDVSEYVGDDFFEAPGRTEDGKLYNVPMNTWYEGIYYNKDIFEQYNIEVPTTFDEFINVCKQLQSVGVKPFTIGAKGADSLVKCSLGYITAEYLLQEEGADFNSKFSKGEVLMAETWAPYLTQWKRLYDEGIINTDMLGISVDQALDEFATGVAAMYPTGTWDYNNVKKKNFMMNFGVMPYLGDSAENACVVGGAGGGFCLNAKAKNMDAARRVMEVIASAEGQAAMAEGSPGSGSLHKGVTYDLPDEFTLLEPVLEKGRIHCAWHNWGDVGVFGTYGYVLQEMLLGNMTVNDALVEVDTIAEWYLEQAAK